MIVRLGGKRLRVSGKTARSLDCCCGGTCPDCAGCPGTRTATIAGLTGNCACANGIYTLTNIGGCHWQYTGATADGDPFSHIIIDFACNAGAWVVSIQCLSICSGGTPIYTGDFAGSASLAHRAGADDCGRLGAYAINSAGTCVFCAGQTAIATVT